LVGEAEGRAVTPAQERELLPAHGGVFVLAAAARFLKRCGIVLVPTSGNEATTRYWIAPDWANVILSVHNARGLFKNTGHVRTALQRCVVDPVFAAAIMSTLELSGARGVRELVGPTHAERAKLRRAGKLGRRLALAKANAAKWARKIPIAERCAKKWAAKVVQLERAMDKEENKIGGDVAWPSSKTTK